MQLPARLVLRRLAHLSAQSAAGGALRRALNHNHTTANTLVTHQKALAVRMLLCYFCSYAASGWMAYKTYYWEGWKAHLAWAWTPD